MSDGCFGRCLPLSGFYYFICFILFLILKSVEKTSLVQILLFITLDLREGFLANNGVRGYDY